MLITTVKDQAQADILGIPVGHIVPVLAPQNGFQIINNLLSTSATLSPLNPSDYETFKNIWRNTTDNPNNFKLSLQPTSLYDQFGNFVYGASAETFFGPLSSLTVTQLAGAYGRNGSLTGDNLAINKHDIESGYNAATQGGTYNIVPVDLGGHTP